MIGLMVPSAFAQEIGKGFFDRDDMLNECHNRAQHLEDLDKCNQEFQDRRMMETIGPFILPVLLGIIFIVLIILVIVVWKLRARSKVK